MTSEDSLKDSVKTIIDRMPHNEKWLNGDRDEAFRIAQQLGLRKQNKNCSACSLTVVNYLRSYIGYPRVVEELVNYSTRLDICKLCPSLLKGVTCKECLCFVHLKTRFKSQQCPLGKW